MDPALQPLPTERIPVDAESAVLAVVRGWVPRVGPFTSSDLARRIGLAPRAVATALARIESEGLVLRGTFLPGRAAPADDPHWCERSVLARVHRLTLGRLRREIEPATAADFLRYLARWQHVAPGTRLHGVHGLAEVIASLQGFHAAAGAWERDLLPARIADYEPGLLDHLCLTGELAWGRLAVAPDPEDAPRRRAAPTRSAPVTVTLREDLPWLLAAHAGPPPPLGPSAQALVEVLTRRGASFLPDLAAATGRPSAEVEAGLWELVSAGVATCDGFSGLRLLVDGNRRAPRRPGFAGGRWSLLRAPAARLDLGDALPSAGHPDDRSTGGSAQSRDAPLENVARQYLRRYGVVFRDLLGREAAPPPWRELVRVYRTLEARGELRGGRFVAGFAGEQFALPEAVDALRAARRAPRAGERIEVSAADPLNLAGILTPGPRVAAVLGNRAAFVDGVPEAPYSAATAAGASEAADATGS